MSYIDSFNLYLAGSFTTHYSLTNEVDPNSFKWQERADYAFGEGEIDIITSKLSFNIPPYSIAQASIFINSTDDGNGHINFNYHSKTLLIQSTATKHPQIDGLYIHHCKLTDPTAILETMIVGTKTFSKESFATTDAKRVDILKRLMAEKYNIAFYGSSDSVLTGNNEYSFGAGTTFYAALVEIGMRNNYRPVIDFIEFASSGTNKYNIGFYWISLGTPPTPVDISGYTLIDYSYNQSQDNYCKYLETEAKNIVDRDSKQIWTDLTCRSAGPAINADTAQINLPMNVESISRLTVVPGSGSIKFYDSTRGEGIKVNLITYDDYLTKTWFINHNATVSGNNYLIEGQSWTNLESFLNAVDSVFVSWFERVFAGLTGLFDGDVPWILGGYFPNGETASTLVLINAAYSGTISCDYIDITPSLVEETYWNTLDVRLKPHYAVYKTGGNTIYNLNARYKTDFISIILGGNTDNVLGKLDLSVTYSLFGINVPIELVLKFTDDSPLPHTYNVEAIAMTNSKLIVGKETSALNEPAWKDLTRTYTNSANVIDMDKLVADMQKKVESLGNIELTFTLDTTVISQYYPIPPQAVSFDGETFYIMALETSIRNNSRTTQYFCSKQPAKIADAIGVEYQFNPIRLPYYATVDRPIYLEYDDSSNENISTALESANNAGTPIFMIMECKNTSSNIFTTVGFRCADIIDDNNEHYLYFEAVDTYSAGSQAIYVSSGVYENRDVPYGNSKSEILYANFAVYILSENIDKTTADLMPNVNRTTLNAFSSYEVEDLFSNVLLYKDGRERLTFTIKIKRN